MIVLGILVFSFRSRCIIELKEVSTDSKGSTLYTMLVLSMLSVIITVFRIPNVLITHLRNEDVAVAVIAKMFTCGGKILLRALFSGTV